MMMVQPRKLSSSKMKKWFAKGFFLIITILNLQGQNTIVGDGFGARSWYKPSNFSSWSYGGFAICGKEQRLYGWGYNKNHSPLISKDYTADVINQVPVQVFNLSGIKYHSGGYMTGVIKNNDSAYVWNRNSYPTAILDNVFFIDAGINEVALVKKDGSLYATYYETAERLRLKQFPEAKDVKRVSVGYASICYLNGDGKVFKIDNPMSTNYRITQLGSPFENVIDIKQNRNQLIALRNDGSVYVLDNSGPVAYKVPISNIIATSTQYDGYDVLFLTETGECYSILNNYEFVDKNVVEILAGEHHIYYFTADGDFHQLNRLSYGDVKITKNWDCMYRPSIKFLNDTICKGDSLSLSKLSFSKTGVYKFTSNDTFTILNLHVFDTVGFWYNYSRCKSDYFPKSTFDTTTYMSNDICYSLYKRTIVIEPVMRCDSLFSCKGFVFDHRGRKIVRDTFYSDTMRTNFGCDSIISTYVRVFSPPIVTQNIVKKCILDEYVFLDKKYSKPGNYKDTIKNRSGCDSVIFSLALFDTACGLRVFIPDAFTPNNSGPLINNTFQPYIDNYLSFKMEIFNRWGEKLHEITQSDEGWDGLFQGEPVQTGVYIYKLAVISETKKSYSFNGTFTLIR